jgi:hypothetical protein
MGYACGAQNPPPHPLNEPDGVSEASSICLGGSAGGGSRPVPVRTWFSSWGILVAVLCQPTLERPSLRGGNLGHI